MFAQANVVIGMSQCEASKQQLFVPGWCATCCLRHAAKVARVIVMAPTGGGSLRIMTWVKLHRPSHRPSARDGLIFRAHIFSTALGSYTNLTEHLTVVDVAVHTH